MVCPTRNNRNVGDLDVKFKQTIRYKCRGLLASQLQ